MTPQTYSPPVVKDVLETFAMQYICAPDDDCKADITDSVKDFLAELEVGNETYNFYFDYFERRKVE